MASLCKNITGLNKFYPSYDNVKFFLRPMYTSDNDAFKFTGSESVSFSSKVVANGEKATLYIGSSTSYFNITNSL